MDVRRASRIALGVLIFAIVPRMVVAQSGRTGSDPATQQRTPTYQDGFVDFALKRINPTDTNYGECLAEGRSLLIEATVRNAYFWSNIVALALMVSLFVIIVYQHHVQAKRDWTSGEMLTQLEKSLTRSEAQVEEATARNRALSESLAGMRQAMGQVPPIPEERADRTPVRAARSHTAIAQTTAAPSGKANGAKQTTNHSPSTTAPSLSSQIALFKPEVELVTKVNALEQQLNRSQETEKQLRRQLNDAGRKLQVEQERNRSLRAG